MEEPASDKKEETKEKTVEDLIHESRMYGDVPKDQFSHQFKLLFHPSKPPKNAMDLLPPDALLGLIKDSKTLLLFQNDQVLLNRFYDMGNRSEGIMEVFKSLFYPWYQQLRLTGALGGTERWLQSFLTPGQMAYEGFSLSPSERKQMEKEAKKGGNIYAMLQKYREGRSNREEKIYI
jgi:hypothetical protein